MQAQEEVTRFQEEAEVTKALAEERRLAVVEGENRHRSDLSNLAALLAEREQLRISLQGQNRQLLAELEMARTRNEGPHPENERLSEAADRLLDDRLRLTEDTQRPLSEDKRLSARMVDAEVVHRECRRGEASESFRLEKEQLAVGLEQVRSEAERRNAALVTEIQRTEKEYDKIADTNEASTDRLQQLLVDKMAIADASQAIDGIRVTGQVDRPPRRPESRPQPPASGPIDMKNLVPPGVWEAPRPILARAVFSDEAEIHATLAKESERRLDSPMTLLYSEKPDEHDD